MSRKQFNNIFLKDFNIKAKKSLENNDTFLSDEEIELKRYYKKNKSNLELKRLLDQFVLGS